MNCNSDLMISLMHGSKLIDLEVCALLDIDSNGRKYAVVWDATGDGWKCLYPLRL